MTAKTVRELTVKSEAKLEQMLIECPAAIEDGLNILERQVPAGGGYIDILAVDDDSRLVVIELKKESDDRVLTQGLSYYDFVRENLERFAQAYPAYNVNTAIEPRLVLVAGRFSATVLAAARYVEIPLTLLTYAYLSIGDSKGPYLSALVVPPPRDFEGGRPNVEEHVAYITDATARKACTAALEWATELAPAITAEGLKQCIILRHVRKNFVAIHARRSFFYVSCRPDWKVYKITCPGDFSLEIKDRVQQSLKSVGGSPADLAEPEGMEPR